MSQCRDARTSGGHRPPMPWLLALALGCAIPSAFAQTAGSTRVFVSDDADDTQVTRFALGAAWKYAGPGSYRGLELETMQVRFAQAPSWRDDRAFFAFADAQGPWNWNARIGTDGESLVGSAALVREDRVRQEYFVERDIVETPQGVQGLYHTFVGAAYDFPLGREDRQQLTALVGVQAFTGDNVRTHVRARYIAVVKPEWGLSVQLRGRAFHSSHPGEHDYYSPEDFLELMPTVQVRRHFAQGWAFSGTAGWGRQRDTGRAWHDAAMAEVSLTSPRRADRGYLRASATYTNTPTGTGGGYGYRQATLEWIQPF
ncbi:hypothetical protein [Agrilutibacter solisilvae]|uniref:DUF2219 family protein n=1 Tax=Agrilutibacter solisilvae TaxID=2763317 RepID=A0A974XXD4_9GAMM|nr:hypothetical protein [Lysobacter solisilvae]QSX77577.1 hypothetical protein I8J32_012560 [Lysobacter solisilvae]